MEWAWTGMGGLGEIGASLDEIFMSESDIKF
jgi:hypothetical protein